jgi:hypothetical protein
LGYLYSPDLLTCLPPITVMSMTCSNGQTGTTYGHQILYVNTIQPSQLANRSLTYTLNPDGSSTEVAYQFYGYNIADRITTSYCTTGGTPTVIDDWAVGADCTGTTYNTTPKLLKTDLFTTLSLKTTISLTGFTYASGDYLLFNVLPAYNNPGYTDTNWELSIKCFTTSLRLSSQWPPISCQIIDTGATMTFTYDSVNCQYVLNYNTAPGLIQNEVYYSDMNKYSNMIIFYNNNWASTGNTVTLPSYTGLTVGYINYNNDGSYNNYYPLEGQLNLIISGTSTTHLVKYTFTNSIDYYDYKNSYTAMTQSANWTNWVPDGQDLRHYKFHQRNFKISMTSGDTWGNDYMYLGYDALFSFDDVNKIIDITTAPMPVTYTGVTCDNTSVGLQGYASGILYIYSAYTRNYDTIWGTRNAFDYFYSNSASNNTTSNIGYAYAQVPYGTMGNALNFSQPGWAINGANYYFYKNNTRVTITNMADPLNNYKVETCLDPITGLVGAWTIIKQVP